MLSRTRSTRSSGPSSNSAGSGSSGCRAYGDRHAIFLSRRSLPLCEDGEAAPTNEPIRRRVVPLLPELAVRRVRGGLPGCAAPHRPPLPPGERRRPPPLGGGGGRPPAPLLLGPDR